MSKVALSGNASGTGTFTIASPNSNTDRTLSLPDASGTVQVSGNPISGTTGTFSGAVSGTTGTFSGAVSGTTASFSGDVTLGSSVLATPTGSAPSYTCRAWVNFNGTGTVAIRASGNVSSITDHATGVFGVNFSTAMPDANYCQVFASNANAAVITSQPSGGGWTATTSTRFETRNSSGTYYDGTENFCAIFR